MITDEKTTLVCPNCRTAYEADQSNCHFCSFPIKGSEKETASFYAAQSIQEVEVRDSFKRIKTGRIILFVLGGLFVVMALFNLDYIEDFIISMVFAAPFLICAFLTNKHPVWALGIPFGLILLFNVLLLLLSPRALFDGLFIKLIILGALGYAFVSVVKARRILKRKPFLAQKFNVVQNQTKDDSILDL